MSEIFVELFMSCFRELRDEEYCYGVVETTAELTETRRVEYRGKRGITYVLNLPHNDQPYVQFAVDAYKRGLVITLVGKNYVIILMYERDGSKFRLVDADVVNKEISAMANQAYCKDC